MSPRANNPKGEVVGRLSIYLRLFIIIAASFYILLTETIFRDIINILKDCKSNGKFIIMEINYIY